MLTICSELAAKEIARLAPFGIKSCIRLVSSEPSTDLRFVGGTSFLFPVGRLVPETLSEASDVAFVGVSTLGGAQPVEAFGFIVAHEIGEPQVSFGFAAAGPLARVGRFECLDEQLETAGSITLPQAEAAENGGGGLAKARIGGSRQADEDGGGGRNLIEAGQRFGLGQAQPTAERVERGRSFGPLEGHEGGLMVGPHEQAAADGGPDDRFGIALAQFLWRCRHGQLAVRSQSNHDLPRPNDSHRPQVRRAVPKDGIEHWRLTLGEGAGGRHRLEPDLVRFYNFSAAPVGVAQQQRDLDFLIGVDLGCPLARIHKRGGRRIRAFGEEVGDSAEVQLIECDQWAARFGGGARQLRGGLVDRRGEVQRLVQAVASLRVGPQFVDLVGSGGDQAVPANFWRDSQLLVVSGGHGGL